MSPPYLSRDELKQTNKTLSVNCIINGETPSARHGSIIPAQSLRFSLRILKRLFFEVKNLSTHIDETACEIIVASAAPLTPISNAKINIGSRIMLHTAPMSTVNMLVFA